MKISVRLSKILAGILLVIILLVLAGAIGFAALQVRGKSRLYRNASEMPDLSKAALSQEAEGDGEDNDPDQTTAGQTDGEKETEDWQEGDVRYQGVHYRYNPDILTFLFLGIDKKTEVRAVKNGIDGGQADTLFLLVLNPHTEKISVIGIPRDTMTEIDIYGKDGRFERTEVLQICLQHGYGDGAASSCERTVKAVSNLFYGLPIGGYCAVNMGAIGSINDAVGGVEVTALEDIPKSKIKKGDTVLLKGNQAYEYLHNRDVKTAASAEARLERQKQYVIAYAKKATEMMKKDITLPLTLYQSLTKYMVTDLSVDEISYLATNLSAYTFDGGDMSSLEGEVKLGNDRFEEFYADEQALYELILKVFYEEVAPKGGTEEMAD